LSQIHHYLTGPFTEQGKEWLGGYWRLRAIHMFRQYNLLTLPPFHFYLLQLSACLDSLFNRPGLPLFLVYLLAADLLERNVLELFTMLASCKVTKEDISYILMESATR
jgi:hypothetical protein